MRTLLPMATVTIKSTINLAGFPEGEVRTVERTSLVDGLLASGYVVEATGDERKDAEGTTRAPVPVLDASAGGSAGGGAESGSAGATGGGSAS